MPKEGAGGNLSAPGVLRISGGTGGRRTGIERFATCGNPGVAVFSQE
jgi:hypothetical protein